MSSPTSLYTFSAPILSTTLKRVSETFSKIGSSSMAAIMRWSLSALIMKSELSRPPLRLNIYGIEAFSLKAVWPLSKDWETLLICFFTTSFSASDKSDMSWLKDSVMSNANFINTKLLRIYRKCDKCLNLLPQSEVLHFGLTMPGVSDSITSRQGRKDAGGSED